MRRCDRCGIPARVVYPIAVGGWPEGKPGAPTFRTVCHECHSAVKVAYDKKGEGK